MMNPLRIIVVCSFLISAQLTGAEVRQPRPRIELGRITLRDGRVLENARLLGATETALNIAHQGGIEQIERLNFAPEILAEHEKAIAAAADEYKAEEAMRRRHEQEKAVEDTNRKIRERQARVAAKRQEEEAQKNYRKAVAESERQLKKREEDEARRAAFRAAELARSRDGILLESFYRESDGIWLTVRNVHENPRRLDWRELRARLADGRIVTPINCQSPDVNDRSWDIRSGEKRSFIVRWYGGDEIDAITWADGGQEVVRVGLEPDGEGTK